MQRYVGDIGDMKAAALLPLTAHFLPERDVLLEGRPVKEVALAFQAGGELPHIVLGKSDVSLLVDQVGNLRVRPFSIKQLKQPPLVRSEPKINVASGHFGQHHVFTLFDVLPGDDAGIQLGESALGGLRREIRQRYLEGLEDIHFGFVRRMVASIPGLRSGAGPCSRATISIVPLEGSTTGLICRTAAV